VRARGARWGAHRRRRPGATSLPPADQGKPADKDKPDDPGRHAAGLAAKRLVFLGETVMTFDGMSIMAIVLVLILGYVLGRMWSAPAKLVGLP
jgi:hypothetical protein